MDLSKKIDESLNLRRLMVLCENRRMRAATIIMNRGTVIEADHVRIINHPETGTPTVVAGIRPGIYPRYSIRYQRIGKHKRSLIGRMRDFTTPGEYVPCIECGQDETGWSDPGPDGRYNAHRGFTWNQKFKHILTIFKANVKDIQWNHESDAKRVHEPERFDYRGSHYQSVSTKPVREFLRSFASAPPVVLDNMIIRIISGINTTIAARSAEKGLDPVVKVIRFVSDFDGIAIEWVSNGRKNTTRLSDDISFGELPALLEKASERYWKSE